MHTRAPRQQHMRDEGQPTLADCGIGCWATRFTRGSPWNCVHAYTRVPRQQHMQDEGLGMNSVRFGVSGCEIETRFTRGSPWNCARVCDRAPHTGPTRTVEACALRSSSTHGAAEACALHQPPRPPNAPGVVLGARARGLHGGVYFAGTPWGGARRASHKCVPGTPARTSRPPIF